MEYASQNAMAGAQLGASATREQRPLESIANAVQRVNNAQVRIQNFLDRFHGAEPAPPMTGQELSMIEKQPPYATTLDRLSGALDRLETRVESLDRIG